MRKTGSIYVELRISVLGMLVKLIVVEEEIYSKKRGLRAKSEKKHTGFQSCM